MTDDCNKSVEAGFAAAPLLGRRSSRFSREHSDWWLRHHWGHNVWRLKRCVLNALTLGLGENIWYGDCPHKHLDKSLLAVLLALWRVNRNDLKPAVAVKVAGAQIVSGARNESETHRYRRVWLFGYHKFEIVVSHKRVERPNGKAHRPGTP